MAVKSRPPWAPQSLVPLSDGSLTFTAKRGKPDGSEIRKSLTAAASRITSNPAGPASIRRKSLLSGKQSTAAESWQLEVIDAFRQIGELQYISTTTANAASRAWVYPVAAKAKTDSAQSVIADEAPEEAGAPPGAIDSELIKRIALLLVLIGECYLVDLPRGPGRPSADAPERESHILGPMNVKFVEDDRVQLKVDGVETIEYPLTGRGAAIVTRIHRPDPIDPNQPFSAARSALPVMRQIVGLMMHVDATTESRVASAGVIEYPSDATVSQPGGANVQFADALTEAMGEAISQPDSASRLVPVLVGVPPSMGGTGEARLKWHMPPGSTLDSNIHVLMDDCIRRLALGMDAPPEVILGAKGLSHFGAWSVEGEFIRLQIAPLLKLIADALTVAYETDYTFDTGPLTVRPNKSVEAQAIFDRGGLSLSSLRAASGFTEDDAPKFASKDEEALYHARTRLKDAPSLYAAPGAPAVLDQERILLGLAPINTQYYPAAEGTPANPVADPRKPDPGNGPESSRPVSDGSPEGGADGKPHDVPGTD